MQEPEIFEAEALARTAIRAKDKDGKWGSFTLKELLDAGQMEEIILWFGDKMIGATGYKQPGVTDEAAAVNVCRIVEVIYGPLVKIKKDVTGVSS